MHESAAQHHGKGIAIVGLAGRFPAAPTVKEFWRNLIQGVEGIRFASDAELTAAGVDPNLISQPDYVPASGAVHEPDFFDAAFFGFSAREAETIDPQQRVFLECAWEALEDAACDPSSYPGAIGVFAGAGMNSYGAVNLFSNPETIESVGQYQAMLGNDKDFLCSRVAYKLNLRGPAISVQTACSTSLVAVQMAFESLRRHECDMALAGGVSIPIPQNPGYLYVPGMILSRDGHCRAFDAAASGTVPGGGVGIAVLKRLEDSIADRDHIYAVIQGAAVNNDGSAKAGYSAPSVEGQRAVIQRSMQMAEFDPNSVSYIEAHGTGTEVGDPIEIAALAKVFESAAKDGHVCALGSVKTNIGHLDAAAGIAGLIKTALCIQHRTIPATLHFVQANPLIDLENTPFKVSACLAFYDKPEPFRAGVSSFGIGGTNAHVSLEEAPFAQSDSTTASQLIVLSAKTSAALDARCAQLAGYLEENPSANLADVAYTLQQGRQAFQHRCVLVPRDVAQLKAALEAPRSQSPRPRSLRTDNAPADAKEIAFLFPGQGAQHSNMGLDLYRTVETFRAAVDRCCEILKPHLDLDLRHVLYPAPGGEQEAEGLLKQTSITQPALFVVEYAMAMLLQECGIRPAAMIGHSVGEYVAACLAGVFSLEDALALIAARGKMMEGMPPGAMLAVSLSESDLLPLLSPETSLAAVNSPVQTVASGTVVAIEKLEATLRSKKIECRRLRTSHAFHSATMDAILEKFVERVSRVKLNSPNIPYLSNLTGTWITAVQATDPAYWGSHLRNTVRFSDCMRTLLRESDRVLLETGPGETLLSLARQHLEPRSALPLIPCMRPAQAAQDDRDTWLTTLGKLWLLNTRLDWETLHAGERRLRVSLPAYPFERQRYWIEPKKTSISAETAAPLKQLDIADWFYVPSWTRTTPRLREKFESGTTLMWLLLAEDGQLSEALASGLTTHGQVVRVRAGERFHRVTPELYEINPSRREDYLELLQDVKGSGRTPDRIVYAWMPSPDSESDVPSLLDRGVSSAMFLIQALEEESVSRRTELNVISDRAYSVFGERVSSPAAAALNAFCKVIPLESPNIASRIIDVDLVSSRESGIRQVIEEVLSPLSHDIVAYRGKYRWIQHFEPVRLEKLRPEQRNDRSIPLQVGGTYMITGGLGGVGLVLAQHLAQTAHARILLISRTPLPAASDWKALLEKPDTPDDVKRRIEGVQAIAKLGGEPVVIMADTTDLAGMRQLLSTIPGQHGPIHGVIHAAGIAGGGLIQTKSREQALAVLSPKVEGTEWIRECLTAAKPDFVLLCSSISAVIPSIGSCDYAAANAYLDGFAAAYDDPAGTRVLSVNWDIWRDVGMATQMELPAALAHLREDTLKHGIRPAEAVEVFDRVLFTPQSQVLISTRNFARLQTLTERAIADLRDSVDHPCRRSELSVHSRPDSLENFAPPEDEIQRFIVRTWEDLLGIEPIGIHDDFFKIGGHSLLGTQLLARMRAHFKIDLPPRIVFEAVTPAELAEHVRLMSWASNSTSTASSVGREEIEIGVQDARLKINEPVGAVDAPVRAELTRRNSDLLPTLQKVDSAPTGNPLKRARRTERIPQTDAQQGLWLIDHFDSGNVAYNIPAAVVMEGFVDLSAVQTAVDKMLARHEILRTSFYEQDGELFQAVSPEIQARVKFTDLSTLGEGDRDQSLDRLVSEEARKPFDLGQAPLVRFHLFRLSEQRHVIFFNIHHIIADRRSLEILREELKALYAAAARNETVQLPDLPIQYADYAIWAAQRFTGDRLDQQIQYWETKLSGLPAYLDLPGSRPYPEKRVPWGAAVPVEVNAKLRDALIKIGLQEGATLFMTLLAAFSVLLYRTTGREDFCIGSPSTLRKHVETEPLIGLFVNMLVFRCELAGQATFREALRCVRATALDAYDNSDVPFQELVRSLRPDPRSMRSPFFQVTFGFDSDAGNGANRSEHIDTTSGTARFDLTLQLVDSADGIYGSIEYCTDLFDKPSMVELSRQFVALLGEISANPDSSLSNLRISEIEDEGDPSFGLRQEGFWKGTVQRFTARFSHRSQGNAGISGG